LIYEEYFFPPNRAKILLTVLIFCGTFSTIWLRKIPPQLDILDLGEIPLLLAIPLGRWPIKLFDFLTANQFTPQQGAFLVFPTLPEIVFALFFDVLVIYFLTCLVIDLRK